MREQRLANPALPARADARTLPADDLRRPARAPAERSRRLMVIAAVAVVVIAAVAAFLAIQLSSSPGSAHPPGTTPTSCGSPSATVGQHATASATAAVGPRAAAVSNPCQGGKAGG